MEAGYEVYYKGELFHEEDDYDTFAITKTSMLYTDAIDYIDGIMKENENPKDYVVKFYDSNGDIDTLNYLELVKEFVQKLLKTSNGLLSMLEDIETEIRELSPVEEYKGYHVTHAGDWNCALSASLGIVDEYINKANMLMRE